MSEFTIGTLAERSGVSVETIRFYERKGVLPDPKRKESGYRLYSEADLKRLNFILMAKKHGFLLDEIRELLELRADSRKGCGEVRRRAEAKLRLVEEKLSELQRFRSALRILISRCRGTGPGSDCPILEAFDRVPDRKERTVTAPRQMGKSNKPKPKRKS